MKSFLVSICILGMIGIVMGITIQAATTGTITTTVTAKSVSVTRTDAQGTIAYGTVALSGSTTTDPAGQDKTTTFQNNGSASEKFSVASSAASGGTGWTITSGTPGSNTFRHSFATTTAVTWQILDTADTYETATSTIDVNASLNVYLKIEMPSASDYVQKTITITLLAESL